LSLRDYVPIFVENEYETSSALVKSGQLCGSLPVLIMVMERRLRFLGHTACSGCEFCCL